VKGKQYKNLSRFKELDEAHADDPYYSTDNKNKLSFEYTLFMDNENLQRSNTTQDFAVDGFIQRNTIEGIDEQIKVDDYCTIWEAITVKHKSAEDLEKEERMKERSHGNQLHFLEDEDFIDEDDSILTQEPPPEGKNTFDWKSSIQIKKLERFDEMATLQLAAYDRNHLVPNFTKGVKKLLTRNNNKKDPTGMFNKIELRPD